MVPFVHDPGAGPASADPLADLLATVANDGRVVVPLPDLARSLGITRQAAWEVAGGAEAVGTVARWSDAPGGPGVVLATRTAAALGLVVSFDGDRWLHPGDRDPTGYTVRQAFGASETGFIPGYDDRIDAAAIPALDAIAAAEDRERRRDEARDRFREGLEALDDGPRKPGPRPGRRISLEEHRERLERAGRMLGMRDEDEDDAAEMARRRNVDPAMTRFEGTEPAWPIPPAVPWACPACRGARFDFRTYCLWCDRSGADHFIRPYPVAELLATADAERRAREAEKREREARKARRAREAARATEADQGATPKPRPAPNPERPRLPDLNLDAIAAACPLPPPAEPAREPRPTREGKTGRLPKVRSAKPKAPTSAGWDAALARLEAARAGRKGARR